MFPSLDLPMPRRDARQTDSHQPGSPFDDFVHQSIIAALLKTLLPRMGGNESALLHFAQWT